MPVPPINLGGLNDRSKPRVLISGGGIGGLTLAILLHKASIPFLVLEKAKEIKPLGKDEFLSRAKHCTGMNMLEENLKLVHTLDNTWLRDTVGFGEYVISRPELYNLLWRQIPRERILLGKKILSFTQNSEIVVVRCSDGSAYYGNILVGADGAYSAVRQHLYKDLKLSKKSPTSGKEVLPFSCVCLVGQTQALDPEKFPLLKKELSQCDAVLGASTMYKHSSKRNDAFRNSEWGPEEAEALAREVRSFKVPGGKDGQQLTLGVYIDETPRHLMSKVMLEEIVFDTWFGGRTVLIGDGAHD
ncbi:hypothetical protein BG003_009796 [Podila horticola]|nr:hypothetical protein BG003_009796 [Podila horticola]